MIADFYIENLNNPLTVGIDHSILLNKFLFTLDSPISDKVPSELFIFSCILLGFV